jgi:Mg-chelatase subunit ChlD
LVIGRWSLVAFLIGHISVGNVTFVQPSYLFLLLLLLPIWGITIAGWRLQDRRGQRRVALWRTAAALALRSAILVALVLSLAGAQIAHGATNMTTVFVLDASDSVSPAARTRGEAYIASALRTMPEGDRAAVIVFGADAVLERPPSSEKELVRLRVTPDSSATDIGRALRLGMATLPSDALRRVVLLSDGGETRQSEGSSALDVALEARAAGIPVETVSLAGPPAADDVAIETLEAPANASEGQTVRLIVQARVRQTNGNGATKGRLRLFRDRQPVLDTTVDLQAGVNRVPVTATAPRGFHTWEARLEVPGDGVAANNVAFGFTEVRGPPRILLVEGEPGRAANLRAALQAARLQARIIGPAELPQTLNGLDAWDAVVLADVAFRQLPPNAAKLLPAYVRDLGHGLLMIGGEDSYAAGGYKDTPVETALPVTMRVRGADIRPDVAIVLVIDRSGSMSGEKLNLAKEGIAQAFTALEEGDQVGVIAFDTDAQWVVNLQPKPATDTFLSAVGGIGEGGGTDLRPGLEQAANALERANAKIKHVVLLTDGQADRNYDDLVERLKRDKITLSTMGVGEGYDPHLRDIAPATGGRFYEELSFGDIPRLFFDETIRIARRGIVEETFTPRLGTALGPAGRAARELREVPPLHGYNAVTPRETAQVALATPDGDPILAEWQFGLGRAAAWTPDMKGQWARDWVGWNGFGRFAGQVVQSLVARPLASGYEVTTSIAGAALALDLRVDTYAERLQTGQTAVRTAGKLVGPDGKTIDVPLVEREPGRYRGMIPQPDPGVYRVQVVATGPDGVERLVASSGAVVPPSAEYLQREGNPGLLKAISETSGGQADFPAANAFARTTKAVQRSAPITWPLLYAALLLWPIDIALRRLLLPGFWQRVQALTVALLARLRSPAQPPRANTPARQRAAAIERARLRARGKKGIAQPDGSIITVDTPAAGTGAGPSPSIEGQAPPTQPGRTSAAGRPHWRDTRRAVVERPAERKSPDRE